MIVSQSFLYFIFEFNAHSNDFNESAQNEVFNLIEDLNDPYKELICDAWGSWEGE